MTLSALAMMVSASGVAVGMVAVEAGPMRRFGAKGEAPTAARVIDVVPLPWDEGGLAIAMVEVEMASGKSRYQMPLAVRRVDPTKVAAGLAVFVFAEKLLPGGVWIGFVVGKAAADVAWYGLEASARRGVRIIRRGVIARPVRDDFFAFNPTAGLRASRPEPPRR